MNAKPEDDGWFLRLGVRGECDARRVRLICFPYAGAGPLIFREWSGRLPPEVEVVGVRLPGRESRFREALFTAWPPLVATVAAAVRRLADVPLLLFGHSFGASLAYETAAALADLGCPPHGLIVSGRRPPHLPPDETPMHDLPTPLFRQRLRELGGTPPQVLDDPVLMGALEPVLRADIRLAETAFVPGPPPSRRALDLPLWAFCGDSDAVAPCPAARAWERYAIGPFVIRQFPGGHFFIHSAAEELLTAVAGACRAVVAGPGSQ